MVNLSKMASQYVAEGYNELLAESRVCQDIVLKAISESSFDRNVTIKGGVVMRSITGDVRRATRDIDFDFIKYSIEEDEYCFDVCHDDEGVSLLMNSKEQIFAEKLQWHLKEYLNAWKACNDREIFHKWG